MADTIITRVYSNEAAANAVADALRSENFPQEFFDVIVGGGDLSGRMSAARVGAAEAAVYGPMVERGNALVVVRAPFSPLGMARKVMGIVDAGSPVDAPVENPNRYAGDDYDTVMKSTKIQHGYWADFLIPLISHREPAKEITILHGFWADFIMPHLSKRVPSKDITIKHGFWGNFLVPHLSKRVPSKSLTIRHGFWGNFLLPHLTVRNRTSTTKSDPRFPFSNAFGLPMLVRR